MRFFFMGPRILGIRPGISLGPEDFTPRYRAQSAIEGSFLYVVQGAPGLVKIGVTTDPRARLAQLQTGSPYPLSFVSITATPGTGYDIEAAAHLYLDNHRCAGEWFRIPPDAAVGAISMAAHRLGQPLVSLSLPQADNVLAIARNAPSGLRSRYRLWPWVVGFIFTFAVIFTILLRISG